jgi:molecular chaperone DnaJ
MSSSSKRDYYEVLGVSKTASSDEIRKAYKQLALANHPDRNPGDSAAEARFKEATEAYGVLSDDDKRGAYDQFGFAGLEGGGGFGGADIFSNFQDIFSEIFGGFSQQRQQRGPKRGRDVRVQQRLTLKEAVLGCKRELSVRAPSPCETCDGSGAAKGSSRKTCPGCGGAGQVSVSRGFMMFAQTCGRCQGQGSVVDNPCTKCRGAGEVEKTKKVNVTFPAGIDAGQRLRVPGQGMPGPSGSQPGDLYVDVDLEEDERFQREGQDLVTRVEVSFTDAALGTKLAIPLLDDTELDLDIPAGTQPGDVLVAKNRGVPRIDGRGKGSLHLLVQVPVPKKVSAKAKELLQALAGELSASPQAAKRVNASG